MTTTGTTKITSSLRIEPAPLVPPQEPGRECCCCGSKSNLLIPAGDGMFICLNAQRCGS